MLVAVIGASPDPEGWLHLALMLRYESFDSEDWSLEGVQPDTIPNVLSLSADPYDYDVFVISLGFSYALGAT